jgi:hypothetical protein
MYERYTGAFIPAKELVHEMTSLAGGDRKK